MRPSETKTATPGNRMTHRGDSCYNVNMRLLRPSKPPSIGPLAKWTAYGASLGLVFGFAFGMLPPTEWWRLRSAVSYLAIIGVIIGSILGLFLDFTRPRVVLNKRPEPPRRPWLVPSLFQGTLLGTAGAIVAVITIYQKQFAMVSSSQRATLLYVVLAGSVLGLVGGWLHWRRGLVRR